MKAVTLEKTDNRAAGAESGFTLIELSIVLVIIGLIVGGVLVGQEMIKAAQIRSVVSQFEKYNTAVNIFRNKYGGIPGDLASGATFFTTGVDNGDGNLILSDSNVVANDDTDFTSASYELLNFFPSMSAAGLLDANFVNAASATALGTGGNYPLTKLGRGGVIVMSLNGINRYHVGMNDSNLTDVSGEFTFADSTLSPIEAFQIDAKMDDGVPNAGSVVGRDGATAALIAAIPAATGNNLCLATAATYNVGSGNADADRLLCQLQLRMN